MDTILPNYEPKRPVTFLSLDHDQDFGLPAYIWLNVRVWPKPFGWGLKYLELSQITWTVPYNVTIQKVDGKVFFHVFFSLTKVQCFERGWENYGFSRKRNECTHSKLKKQNFLWFGKSQLLRVVTRNRKAFLSWFLITLKWKDFNSWESSNRSYTKYIFYNPNAQTRVDCGNVVSL